MKQYGRRLSLLVLAAFMCTMFAATVFAAEERSVLRIKDLQGAYEVIPGSAQEEHDLFTAFKEVMPGDIRTQKVEIQNQCREGKDVCVYLAAISPKQDPNASSQVLPLLKMRIWKGDELLLDGSADTALNKAAGLGIVPYCGSTELTVELEIPVELNNEQIQAASRIEWLFAVEDASLTQPNANELPQTGDSAWPLLWIVLAIASLVGVIILLRRRK